MNERAVIIGDLHGNDAAFREVVRWYGEDMLYVPNGDLIDRGGGTNDLLNIMHGLNTEIVLGNHELVLLAALNEIDPERRAAWQRVWLGHNPQGLGGYEDNTLDSYYVGRSRTHEETAKKMRDRMRSLGHLAMLENAKWYYETDTVLAVHAGLEPTTPWQEQRAYLDKLSVAATAGNYTDQPRAIFDVDFLLSKIIGTPSDLSKPLVTGHDHRREISPGSRRWPHSNQSRFPKRVFLGSHLQAGDPVFVYETWTGQVHGFDHDGGFKDVLFG